MTVAFAVRLHLDDEVEIAIEGDLDLNTAPDLDAVLLALTTRGHRRITVDGGDLRFVDAAGIRVLADAHRRAVRSGGALEIRSLPALTRRLVQILGVHELLDERDRHDHAPPDDHLRNGRPADPAEPVA